MILSSTGEKMLNGSGSISHKKAIQKAKAEYRKYQVKTISPVEEEYLNTIKEINNKIHLILFLCIEEHLFFYISKS